MKRTAMIVLLGEELEEITCERFGSTMDAQTVWWDPETKLKFLYFDLGDYQYFEPYDGPVIHGTGYTF